VPKGQGDPGMANWAASGQEVAHNAMSLSSAR
jgi:hypothetical protein